MFDAASYSFVPQLKATDVRAPADVLSAGLSPAVVHHPIIKICVAKRYTGGLYRYRTKGGLIVLAYITIKLFPFPGLCLFYLAFSAVPGFAFRSFNLSFFLLSTESLPYGIWTNADTTNA